MPALTSARLIAGACGGVGASRRAAPSCVATSSTSASAGDQPRRLRRAARRARAARRGRAAPRPCPRRRARRRGSRRRGRRPARPRPSGGSRARRVRPPWPSERMNVAHLGHAGRVEPVRRLVEDQQLRVLEQRGGDAEALLHAQRVGRGRGRRRGRSARPRRARRRRARAAHPGVAGEHAQVVAPGQVRVEGRAPRPSRRSARARPASRARAPSTVASPDVGRTSPSSIRSVVVLPAPFGPEEAVDLAAPHAQVERVDGDDRSP